MLEVLIPREETDVDLWQATYQQFLDDYQEETDINSARYIYWHAVEDHSVLTNLQIVADGYGICNNCDSPAKLHLSNISDEERLCARCLGHRVIAFAGVQSSGGYTFGSTDIRTQFLPNSVFPKHEESDRILCSRCDKYVLTEAEAGMSTKYLAIEVDGSFSRRVTVHNGCSVSCEADGCDNRASSAIHLWTLDNINYCRSCYDAIAAKFTIYSCGYCNFRTIDNDTMIYSDMRDHDLCPSCYDSEWECDNCSRSIYGEDNNHDCEYDDEEESSVINNYSYKPRPVFFGEAPYHLGLELEVEEMDCDHDNRNHQADKVYDMLGNHAYLKSDGSLDVGFEIVTHPHSLEEFHKLDWSFLRTLVRGGMRSWQTDNCGIHVHIGLTAFKNDQHEARFIKFIYDNEPQVTRIAGRSSNYARFTDKGQAVAKVKYKDSRSWDRYQAVNNQNSKTLEVRVFRGSLRKERVLSAIEFVHAVAEYTRDLKLISKDKPFSWGKFVGYIASNTETYPNLFIIINELFEKMNQPIVEDKEE